MFRIKPVSSYATTTPKLSKTDNVPINVVDVVTIHIQQSEQLVFKEKESVKTKGAK
jgi:hypothetical protein